MGVRMISFATIQELNEIKAIWRECFGDTDAYIDFFFTNHCIEEETLIYKEDGKVIGMLNLLPATLTLADGAIPVRYVYAVATLPQYQGRGVARELLSTANKILGEQGIATVLVPASEGLFRYYERHGYQTLFHIKEYQFSCQEAQEESREVIAASIRDEHLKHDVSLLEVSSGEYKRLRDHHFEGPGYLKWSEAEIAYAIKENALLGGKTKKVVVKHHEDILMYYIDNATLVVKETTLKSKRILPVLKEIALSLGCDSVSVRTSNNCIKEGSLRPFGMICGLEAMQELNNAYLNLVLD